ncbi:MAG: hypothetical protein ACKKMS_00090 [Candidatus Nealsonbacteria bacterium]
MKLSVAIMMHLAREKYKEYLLSKLGNVPIAMDRGKGLWDTAKRAWLAHNPEEKYHIVIQDDAIIGKDFYLNIEKEINRYPNQAYSFYFGNRKGMREIAEKGEKDDGVMMRWISWGVAICLPTRIIPEMVKFCDEMKTLEKHDDTRISHFLKKIGMKVWYPIPSLVDHRPEKSLIQSDLGGGRKAYKFIGE